MKKCKNCGGKGVVEDEILVKGSKLLVNCGYCNGTGKIQKK